MRPPSDEGTLTSGRSPGGGIETVRVWLLGGFRVRVGSQLIEGDRWRQRKAASLVKLLALAPGHRLHRERVMDLLWPDLDATVAANNLRQALHVARRIPASHTSATASRYLERRGEQLALCPGGQLCVDVEAFEETATAARHARDPGAYRAALDLYAGDLLPGDRYEAWAQERREGLRLTYLSLLLEMAAVHEERGEHGPGIEALRRVVAEEPSHEEAHVGLMRLLAQRGGWGEAILQYEGLRKVLSRELDTEPSPATQRLYEEVRAGRLPAAPAPSAGRQSEESMGSSPTTCPPP